MVQHRRQVSGPRGPAHPLEELGEQGREHRDGGEDLPARDRCRLEAEAAAAAFDEGGKKKGADTPPNRSATEAKPKRRPKEFWDQVGSLGERFTLIYGTDTAYDHDKRKIIKVSNMRIAFGKDPVNFWLQGRDRRMVDQDNVVFDPTGKAQLPDYVNLFYGMQLQPDASKECTKILALLFYLCNEEDAVFQWVLKWIAYPLQHPGAKMESAVVMHGEEGLGKNFFWDVVSRIYRDYATVITQNELESQFNTWSSRKLFMVANEVVSRSELREHKGRLKNYITERELQINEKLLPLRTERNHMNFVFLSNETQPLALDRTDRRYLVIWTPPVAQPIEFYKAVGGEVRWRRSRWVVCTPPRHGSRRLQ
jgi:putative DNA primase/helicase